MFARSKIETTVIADKCKLLLTESIGVKTVQTNDSISDSNVTKQITYFVKLFFI